MCSVVGCGVALAGVRGYHVGVLLGQQEGLGHDAEALLLHHSQGSTAQPPSTSRLLLRSRVTHSPARPCPRRRSRRAPGVVPTCRAGPEAAARRTLSRR